MSLVPVDYVEIRCKPDATLLGQFSFNIMCFCRMEHATASVPKSILFTVYLFMTDFWEHKKLEKMKQSSFVFSWKMLDKGIKNNIQIDFIFLIRYPRSSRYLSSTTYTLHGSSN